MSGFGDSVWVGEQVEGGVGNVIPVLRKALWHRAGEQSRGGGGGKKKMMPTGVGGWGTVSDPGWGG